MAIRDGRVVAVGHERRDRAARRARTPSRSTSTGKTVLPGLIDSHVHAPAASMYEFDHPVPDMETVADVLAYIRARAAATQPGAVDHAVAGLHHAPSRPAVSDPRRARSRGAPAPGRLPHRPRRLAELARALAQRDRRDLPGPRRRAGPDRARPAAASPPASSATARASSGPSRTGPEPTDGRPPGPAAAAARRLQRGRHHQHRRRQRRRAASSCIARCSRRRR